MKFLEYIPNVNEGNIHVAASLFVLILLAIGGLSVYRKIKFPEKCVVPPKKFSLTNIFELIVETTLNMSRDIIGKNGEKYVPFIGTIFIFILTCNLLGMIPGFIPPTENVNTNLACAIVVFLTTHYFGIREHGVKYIKKFMAPVTGIFGIFLSLIFFPVEIVSNVFRLLSLSIRPFGNINADHTVLHIIATKLPIIQDFPILIPVPFLFLGLLVAFMQAFIFALLSMIYISLAVSHDH